jgi:translation initiation factor IF-1
MNEGGETSFELVGRGPAIVFYVEDHGTPMPMQGARGTVTVTRGTTTASAEVRFDSGNRLVARLPHRLRQGDRVLVKVTMANGSISAGRYVLP